MKHSYGHICKAVGASKGINGDTALSNPCNACAPPLCAPIVLTGQALDDVQHQLDALTASCTSINAAVSSAKSSSSGLLSAADKLARDLAQLDSKRAMVEQFLDQYQLTPEEVWRWDMPQ